MRREYEKLFEKSEFSKNCDLFIEKINNLGEKYQHIDIEAINNTTWMLNSPKQIQETKEYSNKFKSPEPLKSYEEIIRSKDIESATQNVACVDIWAKYNAEKPIVVREVIFALHKILLLSKKYSGKLLTNLNDFVGPGDEDVTNEERLEDFNENEENESILTEEEQEVIGFYEELQDMNFHLEFLFTKREK